jgi:predicted ABC-type exoprotein transport system permease subunit
MMVARVNDLESRAKSYLKKVMLNTTFDKLVKHVKKRNKRKK